MGKIRKEKIRLPSAVSPLMSADLNAAFGIEDVDENYGPIEAITDQLQSVELAEKLNGLQTFAVIALNRERANNICKSGLIRIAAPLLCEKNDSVRDATAGAFRNLSISTPDVCDLMVESDVLTPLLTVIVEYVRDDKWTPTFDTHMGNQIDLHSDIFLQNINLLRNLCETSPTALETFNQAQILDSLIRCLDHKRFGLEIAISVAQCLLVVSENNTKSWHAVNTHAATLHSLLGINKDQGELYLATLAAGILCNVPALSAAYAVDVLRTFDRPLSIDYKQGLENINKIGANEEPSEPQLEIDMDMNNETEETEEESINRRRCQDLPTPLEIAVNDFGYLLDAQQLAAEIISNLCASEEENWCDVDDDSDDDSEAGSVVDCKMSELSAKQDDENLNVDIVGAIKSLQLVSKIWQRAQPVADGFELVLANNESLAAKLKKTRTSCLLCLQNLCASLSLEDLGGFEALYNVWVQLGLQFFKGPRDVTLMEPITALMRAALNLLKPCKSLFEQMTQQDLELILSGANSSTVVEVRSNWLSMLGTLGCLLPEPLVKVIIAFILDTCSKDDNVYTLAEALDSLMDIFAGNDWHRIMIELNMLEVMQQIEKQFKSKARQQRRELKEQFAVVKTVKTNLTRFVKYIEDELSKCNKEIN